MDWREMAEDWAQLREILSNINYIYVRWNAASFIASWVTISFW
jgi:hypothetical protein